MNIIEKNEGAKIPYEVNGTKITFDDDLSLDLDKRQKEYPFQIDICRDAEGDLTTTTKGAMRYVAQIALPAAEYEDSEDGIATKKPLDMDDVTLTLWSIE